MKTQIKFVASVKKERIKNIKSIIKKLEALGCNIDTVLSTIGVISGSIDSSVNISSLKIDGIDNIELDQEILGI